MKKKKSSPVTKIFLAFPNSFHPYIFVIIQYLYALVTMAPSFFYYKSFFLHTLFILFIVFLSIFNGADCYIEVFSLRYRAELARLEEQASILSPLILAEKASIISPLILEEKDSIQEQASPASKPQEVANDISSLSSRKESRSSSSTSLHDLGRLKIE